MKPERPKIDYFSSAELRQGLGLKTVRGGVASMIAQGLALVVSLGSIAALSRLLNPADFGLMAMVVVFTRFAGLFVDAGLSMAAVQERDLTRQQSTNLFWFGTLMGTAIGAVMVVISPLVAWFYQEPRLIAVTSVLGVSFLFNGLAVQHRALLRRGMQFVAVNTTRIIAAIAGKLAGIAWAVAFYGKPYDYWALVVVIVVTAAANTLGVWLMCPWRPGLPRRGAGSRRHFLFGANLTGFTTINHFARNADNLLIGWWWNAAALGVYERAYRVFDLPRETFMAPLSSVATSTLSRLLDEPAKYRDAYLRMAKGMLAFTAPISAYCAVCPDIVVYTLLGAQWVKSIPLLQLLSIFGLYQSAYSSCGWLLITQDRTTEFLRWSIVNSVLTVAAFCVGLPFGPAGVALGYGVVFLSFSLPSLFWVAGRRGPVTIGDLWRSLLEPTLVSLVVAAACYVAHWMTIQRGLLLATIVTAGIAISIVTTYIAVSTDYLSQFRRLLRGRGTTTSASPTNPPTS
ncbi:lipopolysaccharide biosynthesis protein [Aeoliella sp. ICT_H6.2]|uniref:Lipopolysaccharide biosynthesis protein n=1 Tax=Aeoliella straminimaris TaxID=2954799 RepID=A0A9X2JGQ4_9BACT|nr:lipopolysaccharide biosynthesis protein [Aeoliella straminimaris]MCO6045250.1 lipopolysaccharide biosynthesis protein [Aeoliella straminimaris]